MTKKRSNTEIIVMEKSWMIRTGLSVLLLEEFNKVNIFEEDYDFETFLSLIEVSGNCCVIINSEKLKNFKRFLHRIPEHCILIPLLLSGTEKDLPESLKYVIDINEDKSQLIETLQRAIELLENKAKIESAFESLSNREQLVLQLIAKGLQSKKIADYLGISTHTVITHRKNISKKLGIRSISGLTVYALLNNLIKIEEAELS